MSVMPLKIATSRYQNPAVAECGLLPVGFTLGYPRFSLRYKLAANLRELAPERAIWGLNDDGFAQAYRRQLDRLGGVSTIRGLLEGVARDHDADGVVLLCYEDLRQLGQSCHRQVFATYWEERTGCAVPELTDTSPAKRISDPVLPRGEAARRPPAKNRSHEARVLPEAHPLVMFLEEWAVAEEHAIRRTAKSLQVLVDGRELMLAFYPDWEKVYFEVGPLQKAGLDADSQTILDRLRPLSQFPITRRQPGLGTEDALNSWPILESDVLPLLVRSYRVMRPRDALEPSERAALEAAIAELGAARDAFVRARERLAQAENALDAQLVARLRNPS